MRSAFAVTAILLCAVCPPLRASQKEGCATSLEFQPVLVPNPERRVTFQCEHATALDLIHAIGRQTRHPIGIVLGQDANALSRTARRYDLRKEDGWSALQIAIDGTGYSLRAEHGVWELIAGDLTPRQSNLFLLRLTDFRSNPHETMAGLAFQLTMWIGAVTHPEVGYAASILGSTNDETFTLAPIPSATVEEIANRIVSLGSRGMWILHSGKDDSAVPGDDDVEIDPYQHYSNSITAIARQDHRVPPTAGCGGSGASWPGQRG